MLYIYISDLYIHIFIYTYIYVYMMYTYHICMYVQYIYDIYIYIYMYIKIWGLGREAPNVIPRMAPMAAPQKNKKLILEEASTTLTSLSPL